MQPNNIGNQPAGPAAEAGMASAGAPVNAASAAPKSPDPTFDNGPSVVEGKGGKKTGWIIGLVLMALIAAGGVGFGVWAWMDGNTQKDALNEQISSLKQQNNSLQEQLNNGDTIINIDTDSDVDTSDYIYVGEWGLKIQILEGLNYVSYEFEQHGGADQVEGSTMAVFGTVGDNLSDFANMYKNSSPLGAVSRILKGTHGDDLDCQYSSLVFSDDNYNYCYEHPQSVYAISQEEQNLEVETVDLIEQMLRNAENYSSI